MARARMVLNPRMFREFASSPGMAALLTERAEAGAAAARAIAPTYTGPTWGPATRAGDYRRSIDATLERSSFGYRSEFGANVEYALQVEFGSGRPATSRERPQEGRSPKWRVLGRALDALRSS